MVSARPRAPIAGRRQDATEAGFTLLGLLAVVAVINIGLGVAVTSWVVIGKRAKEAELIWRGQQYARAFQCHREQTGGLPQELEELLDSDCIRTLYPEPMNPDRGWRIIRERDVRNRDAVATNTGTRPPASGSSQVPGSSPPDGGVIGFSRSLEILDRMRSSDAPRATIVGVSPGRGSLPPETVDQVLDRMDAIRSASERLDSLLSRLREGSGAATGNGIAGVASYSTEASMRLYDGEANYNRWWFVAR